MMKIRDLSYGLLLMVIMITAACDPGAPVDSKAVKEEIQSRKIRKVSASDIMTRALTTGEGIQAEVTRQHLASLLVGQDGIGPCDLQSLPAVVEAQARGIDVSRISLNPRRKRRPLDSLEVAVYEAFEYATQRQLKMVPSLEEINETTLRYWAPIFMNQACNRCHGKKRVDIDDKTLKLLQEQFPEDQSYDFEEGALMGLWRIIIPKKEIIKNL
jgi:hypothetical protein|tara:strand:+ start:869 stop:1510 length:642 start_codon:yes stop_codon:yes gene_type:complete